MATNKRSGSKREKPAKLRTSPGFTPEEREAMRERAKELKRATRGKGDGEKELLEKISSLAEGDRSLAESLHRIVREVAPELEPKTWYGMPAYALDGKVLCFFQPAQKFKTRYATFGFTDIAHLDDGSFWPVAFALKELTPSVEKEIRSLLKRAVSRSHR
jgi:uncharacterized protein YdhG (YjbR/CyaY superfamily)